MVKLLEALLCGALVTLIVAIFIGWVVGIIKFLFIYDQTMYAILLFLLGIWCISFLFFLGENN